VARDTDDPHHRIDRLDRKADRIRLQEGRFTSTATSVDDVLKVVIPGWDDFGELEHGDPDGVMWMPRVNDAGATVYPHEDDWCAIQETDQGTWVVVCWTRGA
jgi:hypothetical protein